MGSRVRQSLAWFLEPDGEIRVGNLMKNVPSWGHSYPQPGQDGETVSQYIQARIKGLYSSRYNKY